MWVNVKTIKKKKSPKAIKKKWYQAGVQLSGREPDYDVQGLGMNISSAKANMHIHTIVPLYSQNVQHKNISGNDGLHVQQWSHKIISCGLACSSVVEHFLSYMRPWVQCQARKDGKKKKKISSHWHKGESLQALVAYTWNPSYSGRQKLGGLRFEASPGKQFMRPDLENIQKWWSGLGGRVPA
jgi:hypothetical protein